MSQALAQILVSCQFLVRWQVHRAHPAHAIASRRPQLQPQSVAPLSVIETICSSEPCLDMTLICCLHLAFRHLAEG